MPRVGCRGGSKLGQDAAICAANVMSVPQVCGLGSQRFLHPPSILLTDAAEAGLVVFVAVKSDPGHGLTPSGDRIIGRSVLVAPSGLRTCNGERISRSVNNVRSL